jgi:hypothetical protein
MFLRASFFLDKDYAVLPCPVGIGRAVAGNGWDQPVGWVGPWAIGAKILFFCESKIFGAKKKASQKPALFCILPHQTFLK